MKFAPVLLLALVSAATAAPAPAKCRPAKHQELPSGSGAGGSQPSDAAGAKPGSGPGNSTETTTPVPGKNTNATTGAPVDNVYPPAPVTNQTWFTDPDVVPTLPPIIGHHPNVTGIVAPEGSVGINPSGGIPPDDPLAKLMIERINLWRSIYKAPPMTWNQSVSGFAVEYARRCKFQHFLGDNGRTWMNGEVLIGGGPIKDADLSWGVKRWIDAWMTEGEKWDYKAQKGEGTGHWEILTDPLPKIQVGCGWQECGNIYCDTWRFGWPDEHYPKYVDHVPPQIEVPWKEYEDPLAS
ncbi:hypothetical protein Q8F55_004781 [Vanrija albida]|uniref:SCP domain-containing protein n=1 Tax=Vanrija albida TaxID=181172 RepID=A0ABR3PZW6_9TREE